MRHEILVGHVIYQSPLKPTVQLAFFLTDQKCIKLKVQSKVPTNKQSVLSRYWIFIFRFSFGFFYLIFIVRTITLGSFTQHWFNDVFECDIESSLDLNLLKSVIYLFCFPGITHVKVNESKCSLFGANYCNANAKIDKIFYQKQSGRKKFRDKSLRRDFILNKLYGNFAKRKPVHFLM